MRRCGRRLKRAVRVGALNLAAHRRSDDKCAVLVDLALNHFGLAGRFLYFCNGISKSAPPEAA